MNCFKKLILLALACVTTFSLVACTPKEESTPEQNAPENATPVEATQGSFTISNAATSEEFAINVEDITEMDSIGMDVLQQTTGGDSTVAVIGADFNELLSQHNLSQKDLSSLRLEAADGYSMDIPKEVIDGRTILLVYSVNGNPLTENEAPIWVVIPEERAMYWVKNVKTIHLNEGTEAKEIVPSSVTFLDTVFGMLETQEYEGEAVVSGADIFDLVGISKDTKAVMLEAADGLEKSETYEILSDAMLTTTGEFAPKITGDRINEGMRVKNVLSFCADGKTLFSLSNFKSKVEDQTFGEVTGTPVLEVLKAANITDANSYVFTASDGYEKELNATDIENGLIYVNEEGKLTTYFDGLPKNTTITDLKSISAK